MSGDVILGIDDRVLRHIVEDYATSGVLALVDTVKHEYPASQGRGNIHPAPALRRISKRARRVQQQHPTLGKVA